jgi:UDP-2-acetamido-2-deoxy-ribo-hexuluronate aminotransferase
MNFIDLQEQYHRYKTEIHKEMDKVLESAQFIMGPAVEELEKGLALHAGVAHAIACSSGTDALILGLLALGIQAGDEVILPDFTFFATAETVAFLGAVPIFVDIREDTFNIDPAQIERHVTPRTKAILPVSIFGQCADFREINEIAQRHHLRVFEDAAQSYGAIQHGKKSCGLTEIAATSFFPAKPLGCYGDGGAVMTMSDELAGTVRMLLNHGQSERYKHSRIGINGRLDTIQAAVLNVKLRHFDEEMEAKRRVAIHYGRRLKDAVRIPVVLSGNESVWAQYTIRSNRREQIAAHLKSKGFPTAIHYPIPLHRQEAFVSYGLADSDFPASTAVSREVLSLPMHPFLSDREIDQIADAILEVA